ncbi:arylesterase [Pseudoprimorskyibacter insulae]|uniref:Esterase TesA n=1 Tax=Pseudoprimorskyibacter insulae TaxID=1695997 RepID=A0A2R8APH3_9RHOB|nr:arylesterase [Pseudoprimorskyibacter insulae]SPF77968.1 Esterase TesA [Pseudoprimorskyibacter insulae]
MFRCFTYGARALTNNLAALMILAAPAVADERVDILAFGDSLTQGYGLIEQEGFVPQLRGWLAGRGHDVRVVNGGVSGDTTAGGFARIAWSLSDDIDAIIVALGGNDVLRGIAPEVARANLDGIMTEAQTRGVEVLLVGIDVPGNYGAEYKSTFEAIYPDLAATYDALLFESFLDGLAPEGGDLADLGAYLQADGIHPNGAGVTRIVEAIGPSVEALIEKAGQ